MDRFGSIVLVGGIGCFVLAFLLSGLYPYLLTDASMPEATLEELAADVPATFKDLKERFPVAFDHWDPEGQALILQDLLDVPAGDPRRAASEAAWRRSYAAALRRGRDAYVGEGCWHCHSQYVRPVANEEVRFGPVSVWAQDNNALQRPVMWGTRRVGPDLTYEGGLRSNDWHVAHFWNPTDTSPGSVMPRYPWMLRQGFGVHRRIDPDVARRGGLDPDTAYAVPGVYETEAEAEAARAAHVEHLPASLAAEAERMFVAEARGLNSDGVALVAYLQWLGTWMPDQEEPE